MTSLLTETGQLMKMTHELADPIRYFLSLDRRSVEITSKVGSRVKLAFSGTITCIACGRKTKKSYDQGYCFPCARDLPENDICSVRPERCQHESGSEADREFWRTHCNVEHVVYLSLTSGVKVGVTRHSNLPGRWIDQGAVQALVIARLPERKLAGQMEVALARRMADKTNWRRMLKGEVDAVDLLQWREKVRPWAPESLRGYCLDQETVQSLNYPVREVPEKIASHNLDKEPELTGRLMGIKGQYLIFEQRVINLRKYAGYHVAMEFEA